MVELKSLFKLAPALAIKSVNIYGEPIYVPETATKDDENKIKEQLRTALIKLEQKF